MQRSPEDPPSQDKPAAAAVAAAGAQPVTLPQKQKKFNNGWTRQLEQLAAEWADKAACYRWMHEKTEAKYSSYNMYFTIPTIILSTLTGTANFGVDSFLPDPSYTKFASAAIGGVSLLTGVITTVSNFLRYAQASEAHRVAGVSWGKFQRFISTELALHPNERMDSMSFLKMGRIELDRLIEQSPSVPPATIQQFTREFSNKEDIKRPEIAGGIERTRIYDDRENRVARIAADAAMFLQQKRNYMKQLILDDFDKQLAERTRQERKEMEEDLKHEILRTAREAAAQAVAQRMIVKPSPISSASTVISIPDTKASIPPNIVSSARNRFETSDTKPAPLASLARDVAREARARRPPSPASVRLELDTGVITHHP